MDAFSPQQGDEDHVLMFIDTTRADQRCPSRRKVWTVFPKEGSRDM